MKQVIAFIDGLNLYHTILKVDNGKYRWLDVKSLCQSFLKQDTEVLNTIYYFTALAEWDLGKVERHKTYIKALQYTSIKIVLGNFKKVTRRCRGECRKDYKTYEEKETDVNIAIHLFAQGGLDKYDKIMLVSGDTDLTPAVKMVKEYCPQKEIHVILPADSRSYSLRTAADQASKIKGKNLHKSQFPDVITTSIEETIYKPSKWFLP